MSKNLEKDTHIAILRFWPLASIFGLQLGLEVKSIILVLLFIRIYKIEIENFKTVKKSHVFATFRVGPAHRSQGRSMASEAIVTPKYK